MTCVALNLVSEVKRVLRRIELRDVEKYAEIEEARTVEIEHHNAKVSVPNLIVCIVF